MIRLKLSICINISLCLEPFLSYHLFLFIFSETSLNEQNKYIVAILANYKAQSKDFQLQFKEKW